MPYMVENRGGKKPWKIIKKETGEVVGSSMTEEEAMASVRARYAADTSMRKKKDAR